MSSEKLRKAREYEQKHCPSVAGELPRFHVTGGIGWINDPNGFAPYQGEYHLFYQHHPYDTNWGPMHWGHVKTKDFISWQRLPIAMAPDMDFDKDGCFSGGAVEMPDGRHLLMYTGVRNVCREDGTTESFQTQCVAFGDGLNYEKYEGNPVIDGSDLPQGGDVHDFRDPKVWRDEDGYYYAVIGNRPADGSGSILMYRSADAIHWEYVSTVASCRNQYGKMWECPDLFALDGKTVLLTSPQEMRPVGLEFHPGNANVCLIGTMDPERRQLEREQIQAIDYGTDFYAPQTLCSTDGRRIMIGWMQNWETSGFRMPNQPFMGQMTIPRELRLENGRLCQLPVRELEGYRRNKVTYEKLRLTGAAELPGVQGRFLDMTVQVAPGEDGEMYRWFEIQVAKNAECDTTIHFDAATNILSVDRTRSGLPCDIVNVRRFYIRPDDGRWNLRLIMDRYSLEVFVNDGAQAASSVIYTPLEADGITFSCDTSVTLDVEKYDIVLE